LKCAVHKAQMKSGCPPGLSPRTCHIKSVACR
jgi:hypothetical protein